MPVFNKMVYNGTEYILGGGGNIGEPLNLTVTSVGLDATITWEDNEIGTIPPTTFQKSELVRKIGSAPTSPSDGDLVVTETVKDTYKVSGYVDQGLTDGETYYYRVFSYSDLGGISYCDAVSVTISGSRQPGANTVMYFPFKDDQLDKVGSATINTTGTNETLGYTFSSSGEMAVTNGSTACVFVSAWIKWNSSLDSIAQSVSSGTNGQILLNFEHSYSVYDKAFQIEQSGGGSIHSLSQNVVQGTRYHLAMGYDGTNVKCYINGSNVRDTTATAKTGLSFRFGYGINETVSEYIGESVCWTSQEVADYFDQTKGDYGIS